MVGSLEIFLAGIQVVAFDIGPFTVHQVQVGHGVVVVGPKLDRFVKIFDAFLDRGSVLDFQFGADLFLILVLGAQVLIRLHAELGTLFHARLVADGPVDDADRVVGIGIIRIEVRDHVVVFLGLLEFFLVVIKGCNALGCIYLLIPGRIFHLEDVFVLLNGLFGHFVVVGSVSARNVLLSEGGGQVHLGVNQIWIQGYALLEMVNGLFELVDLLSLHPLFHLVSALPLSSA